jgi:hypothetical protein
VVAVLLGLRFALELALIAALAVVGVHVGGGTVQGWLLAAGLTVVVIGVWGILLSPKRRVDLPLGVRVLLELALFAGAAWGLIEVGYAAWGWALIAAEVVVVAALWSKGLPPGTDLGDRSARGSTHVP